MRDGLAQRLESVYAAVSMQNGRLVAEMDVLCDNVELRAQPSAAERLLPLLQTVLRACVDSPNQLAEPGPAALQAALDRAADLLEGDDLQAPFRRDFQGGANIGTLAWHLRRWTLALCAAPPAKRGRAGALHRAEQDPALQVPGQYAASLHDVSSDATKALLRGVDVDASGRVHFLTACGRRQTFFATVSTPKRAKADTRAAQLFAVVDFVLARSVEAQKRRLRFSPSRLVRIGALRLADDPAGCTSLAAVSAARFDAGACALSARKRVADAVAATFAANSKTRGHNASVVDAEIRAKHEAYEAACREAPADALAYYASRAHDDAESLWAFRRAFAAQHAVVSLLGHVLRVQGRAPETLRFCTATRRVVVAEFYLAAARDAAVGAPAMPFRLTRNVTAFLGPLALEGFTLGVGLTALALRESTATPGGLLLPYLDLFLSAARPGEAADVDANVASIAAEVKNLAPLVVGAGAGAIDDNIRRLIDSARAPARLALMEASWQPWI